MVRIYSDKQCTKHSDEKVHWWDRVRLGLFAEATVEALRQQLNRCNNTVGTAVSTAALYVVFCAHARLSLPNVSRSPGYRLTTATSTRITNVTESGLRTKETEISQDILEIDEQNAETQIALQKVNTMRPTVEKDPSEWIEQLQHQQVALHASRKLLGGLLSEAHHMRTGQKITKIYMSNGGKLLVGLINVDGGPGEVYQDIYDVNATNQGKGIVGVVKDFDVNGFFND